MIKFTTFITTILPTSSSGNNLTFLDYLYTTFARFFSLEHSQESSSELGTHSFSDQNLLIVQLVGISRVSERALVVINYPLTIPGSVRCIPIDLPYDGASKFDDTFYNHDCGLHLNISAVIFHRIKSALTNPILHYSHLEVWQFVRMVY